MKSPSRRSIGLTIVIVFFLSIVALGFWAHDQGYNSHTWQAPLGFPKVIEPYGEPTDALGTGPTKSFRYTSKPLPARGKEAFEISTEGLAGNLIDAVGAVDANAEQVAAIEDESTIALRAVITSVLDQKKLKSAIARDHVAGDCFDPVDLQLLDEAEIARRNLENDLAHHSEFAIPNKEAAFSPFTFRLVFDVSEDSGLKIDDEVVIRDQESGQTLARIPTRRSDGETRFSAHGELRTLRVAPVDVIIAVGRRPEVIEVEPHVGQTFQLGKANGQVLYHRSGAWSGEWWVQPDPYREAAWTVGLALDRWIPLYAVSASAILADGSTDKLVRFPRGSFVVHPSRIQKRCLLTAEAPEGAEKLQIHYRPDWTFVRFPLQQLPGLPEENDAIEDRFDTRIPCVRFANAEQFVLAICDHTGMEFAFESSPGAFSPTYPVGEFPDDYFPRTFVNTTPRKLLNELRKNVPHGHFWTDGRAIKYRIAEEQTWLTKTRDWVKGFIERP